MPEWVVPAALDGERVDRALSLITGVSRARAGELLDAGQVFVGTRVVGSRSRKIRTGERLRVEGEVEEVPDLSLRADPSVDVPVVYSDAAVIVVDKPAGLVVHPGAGHREGTLVHGLLARFPDLTAMASGETVDRPGIVHRLDQGTSGLLVVARTPAARDELIGQMSRREVTREYVALVHGSVESEEGIVDGPLGRSDIDPTRFRIQAGGRDARTRYMVESRYELPVPLTLLRCQLETGRTHQIRVHLSSIGHPLVGDRRYGGRPLAPPGGPDRPFLHAAVLGFVHPESRETLDFKSALPADLDGILASIDTSRHPQV
jgi:23S rRNA pseudouridine1911/1915/1917 synthase